MAIVGGKLLAVTSHGGVVAVWTEGAKRPAFYGLPEPVQIAQPTGATVLALTDGTNVEALATNAKGQFVTLRVTAH
jgi:hypothetical protein